MLAMLRAGVLFRPTVSDENGRKNHISTFISIFFGRNGIGFGKCGFGNGIGICGCMETNKTDGKPEN
jgi:hypothetical protein